MFVVETAADWVNLRDHEYASIHIGLLTIHMVSSKYIDTGPVMITKQLDSRLGQFVSQIWNWKIYSLW